VDKSAVSRRVSDLEARLGVQLILRSSRQQSLTEEGQGLYARAQALLADWTEAENEARRATGALRGPIRLSVPLSFGLNRLSPILIDFMAAHPQISLDLDLSDRKVDIAQDGFDLVVRIGDLPDSALRAGKIADVQMMAAASPDAFQGSGAPATLAALSALPEIRYGLRPRSTWQVQTPGGVTRTLEMECQHRVTNGDFAVRAAIAGLGVVIEPEFIVGPAIASGDLVRLLPDHSFPRISAYALWPPARHQSARVRALIDHMVAGCRSA
jgi:DNA-binding transcriptional LysR family regulator